MTKRFISGILAPVQLNGALNGEKELPRVSREGNVWKAESAWGSMIYEQMSATQRRFQITVNAPQFETPETMDRDAAAEDLMRQEQSFYQASLGELRNALAVAVPQQGKGVDGVKLSMSITERRGFVHTGKSITVAPVTFSMNTTVRGDPDDSASAVVYANIYALCVYKVAALSRAYRENLGATISGLRHPAEDS